MNARDYIGTSQHNLIRSKLRTALTVLAVFIGALTISLTNGIGSGARQYINAQLSSVGAPNTLIVTKEVSFSQFTSSQVKEYNPDEESFVADPSAFSLSQKDIETIQSTPGILNAHPEYNVEGLYVQRDKSATRYTMRASTFIDGMEMDLIAGRLVAAGETSTILLAPQYLEPLGFTSAQDAIGKTIILAFNSPSQEPIERSVTIVGVPQTLLLTEGYLFIPNSMAENIYALEHPGLSSETLFPSVIAQYDEKTSPEELDAIKAALSEKGLSASTLQDQIGSIHDVINTITIGLNLFGAIALVAAVFGIVNTLLMSVYERTREIGLMRALGMSKRGIFFLFSVEAMSIGFWGAVLGIGASMAIGAVVNRVASQTFLESLRGFDLFAFPLYMSLGITAIIVLISFLAGVFPALKASRLNPISALRYE